MAGSPLTDAEQDVLESGSQSPQCRSPPMNSELTGIAERVMRQGFSKPEPSRWRLDYSSPNLTASTPPKLHTSVNGDFHNQDLREMPSNQMGELGSNASRELQFGKGCWNM